MTLHKTNTFLETSASCTNGVICPFKVLKEKATCMRKNYLRLPDLAKMKRWYKLLVM